MQLLYGTVPGAGFVPETAFFLIFPPESRRCTIAMAGAVRAFIPFPSCGAVSGSASLQKRGSPVLYCGPRTNP